MATTAITGTQNFASHRGKRKMLFLEAALTSVAEASSVTFKISGLPTEGILDRIRLTFAGATYKADAFIGLTEAAAADTSGVKCLTRGGAWTNTITSPTKWREIHVQKRFSGSDGYLYVTIKNSAAGGDEVTGAMAFVAIIRPLPSK